MKFAMKYSKFLFAAVKRKKKSENINKISQKRVVNYTIY